MSDISLEGKVAIVTGAGSPVGLGRAMAAALVEAGARVAMLDVNRQQLEATAAEIAAGNPERVLPIVADVSSEADAEMAVRRTIDELGGLHVLINNAGVNTRTGVMSGDRIWERNFSENTPDEWNRLVSVNRNGPVFMARAAVGHLVAQGWGRIIGVTTSLRMMIDRGSAPYGPTKAGHEALVSNMSRDLEGTGVTANVLTPGAMILTNIFSL